MNLFFRNLFSESECKKVILDIRFGERVLCPKCNYHKIYELKHKDHFFKCTKCLSIFNEKTETLFENSRIPLEKWFCVFYLLCFNKKVSSVRVSKILKITQSSAWHILEKIKTSKDRRLINEIKKYIKNRESKRVKPVVQWSGSKRAILQELLCRLPRDFNNYFEPFLGGGSLFLALYDKILTKENNIYISDINKELIICYEIIQEELEALVDSLRIHNDKCNMEYYYFMRDEYLAKNKLNIASRFLFLNKSCFNGLYKTDKNGKFIGSFGYKDKFAILDKNNLELCHNVLHRPEIHISNSSYEEIEPLVKEGDFVYFDPPYFHYHSKEDVDYVGGKKFNQEEEHIKLRDSVLRIHEKGAYIMFSNSNTEFICDLFDHKDFNIDIIKVKRNISHVGRNRGLEEEIIVRNYK
ncbi:Dam family site-specific DNA-(adenine-N6)-methyltransferase [Flavobacteriaceae bacterium]|nr:Dam family site-specific DNA-(adenine-N6)-methyltransferase [Flavobacteriaceae bacterium]